MLTRRESVPREAAGRHRAVGRQPHRDHRRDRAQHRRDQEDLGVLGDQRGGQRLLVLGQLPGVGRLVDADRQWRVQVGGELAEAVQAPARSAPATPISIPAVRATTTCGGRHAVLGGRSPPAARPRPAARSPGRGRARRAPDRRPAPARRATGPRSTSAGQPDISR